MAANFSTSSAAMPAAAGSPPPPPPDFPLAAVRYCGVSLAHVGTIDLWQAVCAYELLEQPRYIQEFEQSNELMPYWADLWPTAPILADFLLKRSICEAKPRRVLELGAGLGLVGLALAKQGANVTLTDFAADALRILQIHCRENRLPQVKVEALDFFASVGPEPGQGFDWVVGTDILFEARICTPVLATLQRYLAAENDATAFIADPCRSTATTFVEALEAGPWQYQIHKQSMPGGAPIHIYEIRKAAGVAERRPASCQEVVGR